MARGAEEDSDAEGARHTHPGPGAHKRALIIPFLLWAAALQARVPDTPVETIRTVAELLSIAGALAGLTVAVYRLGVWRQEMHNTKHNVGAEVTRYREETNRNFARLEQRFASMERVIARVLSNATEQRVNAERWQARVDAALGGIGARVAQVESRLDDQRHEEAA